MADIPGTGDPPKHAGGRPPNVPGKTKNRNLSHSNTRKAAKKRKPPTRPGSLDIAEKIAPAPKRALIEGIDADDSMDVDAAEALAELDAVRVLQPAKSFSSPLEYHLKQTTGGFRLAFGNNLRFDLLSKEKATVKVMVEQVYHHQRWPQSALGAWIGSDEDFDFNEHISAFWARRGIVMFSYAQRLVSIRASERQTTEEHHFSQACSNTLGLHAGALR